MVSPACPASASWHLSPIWIPSSTNRKIALFHSFHPIRPFFPFSVPSARAQRSKRSAGSGQRSAVHSARVRVRVELNCSLLKSMCIYIHFLPLLAISIYFTLALNLNSLPPSACLPLSVTSHHHHPHPSIPYTTIFPSTNKSHAHQLAGLPAHQCPVSNVQWLGLASRHFALRNFATLSRRHFASRADPDSHS